MTTAKHLVGAARCGPAAALAAAAVVLGVAAWWTPAWAASVVAEPSSADVPRPTITIGLDDGTIDHYKVGKLLQENGLRGVFYLNSGRLDTSAHYLKIAQVKELQQAGHEIGGHTTFHLHLPQQDAAEQRRQICDDRVQLLSDGLKVSSFAYPFGEGTAATEEIVKSCGYTSARTTHGIGCNTCTRSETVPPAVPFATRALSAFGNTTTSADLIANVERIRDRAGWLQLAFHRICDTPTCPGASVRLAEFTGFVRWLAEQKAAGALNVSTVQQVIGADVLRPVPGPPPTARRLVFGNRSMERQSPTAGLPPACFTYGTAGAGSAGAWRPTGEAHSGRWALRADVLAAGAGINLFTTMDLGSCAPPVRAGRAYRISVWYQSTGPLSFASYLRRPQGSYASFGAAVVFPPAATWTRASWVTLVTPDLEHMALSLGITAAETGTYLVDDLSVRLVRPTPLAGSTGSGPREESPAAPPGGSPASGGSKGATVGGDGAGRRAAPRSGAKAGSQSVTNRAEVHEETPFRPTDAQSVVPLAESRDNGSQLSGRPPWWDFLQMGIALLAAFGMIVLLDRRFGHLHARTRQLLEARRSAPSTSR